MYPNIDYMYNIFMKLKYIIVFLSITLIFSVLFIKNKYNNEIQQNIDINKEGDEEVFPLEECLSQINILPSSIYKNVKYGSKNYAIYQRCSMNIPHPKEVCDVKPQESGIIEISAENKKCTKILTVRDKTGYDTSANNVYDMLYRDNNIYALIVDQTGAGSGEGIAKLISSSDNGINWKISQCFYYIPEDYKDINTLLDKPILPQRNDDYCSNFILNTPKLSY